MIHVQRSNLKELAHKHAEFLLPWVQRHLDNVRALTRDIASGCAPVNALRNCKTPLERSNLPASAKKALLAAFFSGLPDGRACAGWLTGLFQCPPKCLQLKIDSACATGIRKILDEMNKTRIIDILQAEPEKLQEINSEVGATVSGSNGKEKTAVLNRVFPYDEWSSGRNNGLSWLPLNIIEEVNLRTCPYCNRAYIFSVVRRNGAGAVRPDLDHFFDKADFPLLQLSFFNLIPCCSLCNSRLKHSATFNLDGYMHPYFEGFDDEGVFSLGQPGVSPSPLELLEHPGGVGLFLNNRAQPGSKRRDKISNHSKVFELDALYSKHGDIVEELVIRHRIYTPELWNSLNEAFKELNLTQEEVKRMRWGNYTELDSLDHRPLAKLTRDIVKELERDGSLPL